MAQLVYLSVVLTAATVVPGALFFQSFFDTGALTLAWVLFATLLAAYAGFTWTGIVQDAFRKRVLSAAGGALLVSLVAVAFAVAAADLVWRMLPVGDGGAASYFAGLLFALTVAAPTCVNILLLSSRRVWKRTLPPVLRLVDDRLSSAIDRLAGKPVRRSHETWRVFAWGAIALSPVPFAGVIMAFLAAQAHVAQRRETGEQAQLSDRRSTRTSLLVWTWLLVIGFAIAEISAVMLLPLWAFPRA